MTAAPMTPSNDVALVDLLDRVIAGGVVVTGDIVLGVADVDLIDLGLRLVLAPAHEVGESVGLERTRSS